MSATTQETTQVKDEPMQQENYLAQSLRLKNGLVIKNRFLKSATSEQLGDKHHNPTKQLANAYKTWAEGGVGLCFSGNIMIDRTALGEPRNVVLDEKSDLEAFKRWTKAGGSNGTQLWAQLNHPGKQTPIFLSSKPVAPSAIALNMGSLSSAFAKPRSLTDAEVWGIVEKFALAAELAKKVGFTGVQIHGAHGYLVNQFLSPRHNQRSDEWGGTPEKRMKFVLEVYKAIRAKVGDEFAVGIKLNSADFQKDGFTEDESMDVVKALSKLGIDHIEISGGTYESQAMVGDERSLKNKADTKVKKASTIAREAYFLNYAQKLREVTDIPLAVTGGFRSAKAMQEAISSNSCDMVGLARPMMLYPDLPTKAMRNESYVAYFKEPTTGVRLVDDAAMLSLTWYEEQIHRMGVGKKPKPNLSAWVSVAKTYARLGKKAFAQRRA